MPKPSEFTAYAACTDLPYDENIGYTDIGKWEYHGAACICIAHGYGASENKAAAAASHTLETGLYCGCHSFKSLAKLSDEEREIAITERVKNNTSYLNEDHRKFGSSLLFATMNKGRLMTYQYGIGGIVILTESDECIAPPPGYYGSIMTNMDFRIQSVERPDKEPYINSKLYDLNDIKGLIIANAAMLRILISESKYPDRIKEIINKASAIAITGFAELLKDAKIPLAIGIMKK